MRDSSGVTKHRETTSIIVYSTLALIAVIAIGMAVFQSQYIYPRFVKQLLENTEDEALRTAKHMMRTLVESYDGEKYKISDQIKENFESTVQDFNLFKIKIFSSSGKTLYSTSEKDVGVVNTNPYFHDIVAKGRPYTKIVKKDTASLEDQVIPIDVVETYVPIMHKGRFLGAFELYYNITVQKEAMDALVNKFEYLLNILGAITVLVAASALVIYRKNIKERRGFENTLLQMAHRDTLTGLYNRRRFEELLKWEVDKFGRYGQQACLLMFDLDHFKKVNDTYGHQAGDEVLAAVARNCKKVLRKSDIVGRYGGEEFIVFLPETDRDSALKVAEKLRQTIELNAVKTTEGNIRVTISVGAACLCTDGKLSVDKVIKQADDSLYAAKKNGRNQVCCAL